MSLCTVSGNITDPSGNPVLSVTVFARITQPVQVGNSTLVPAVMSAETNASGNFSIALQQSISVIFTIQYPPVSTEPKFIFEYTGTIPATTTASFNDVITLE